jgi:nucleoside-diphosphate-sugar epimerase
MSITILGASGFIGSALVRHLDARGEQVVRLDLPDFDLTLPDTFNRIPLDTDILIHAAGYVGNANRDELLWKINVESTYYLIQYLTSHSRLRLVVYLSSGAVYGMPLEPVTTASPLKPEGLYATSKLLAECLLQTQLNSQAIRLRLFFPFGPGQRPPRLIPSLIQRIARSEPIEINTQKGYPIINPIFIDTLVDQIAQIIYAPEKSCYNLGGVDRYSIRQIAEIVAKQLGVQVKFLVKDNPIGNLTCLPDLPVVDQEIFETQLSKTIENCDYL